MGSANDDVDDTISICNIDPSKLSELLSVSESWIRIGDGGGMWLIVAYCVLS